MLRWKGLQIPKTPVPGARSWSQKIALCPHFKKSDPLPWLTIGMEATRMPGPDMRGSLRKQIKLSCRTGSGWKGERQAQPRP